MTAANSPARPDAAFNADAHTICVRVDCATRMLGIGKTKLYELIAEGELETIRIGRRTLILQASIDALIQRLRNQPSLSS